MAMDAAAKEMVRQGIDVISFGVGEPDFDTPENVKEAAIKAMRQGRTKYTPASGIHELKVAIQQKLARDNSLEYGIDQIIVTVGAKHALYNITQVLLRPGRRSDRPRPLLGELRRAGRVTGATPVVVETTEENGFRMTAEQLREAITPRTKAIMLNSPSNPTGAVYRREHLEAIAEVAVEKGIAVISDEIYEPFIYGGAKHVSIAQLGPEIKALTLVVHGVSKSHAMTGWRIGYVAGDARVIKAIDEPAKPQHLQPHVHRPMGGGRGAHRAPGARRSRWWPSLPSAGSTWSSGCGPCPASSARCPRAPFMSFPGSRPPSARAYKGTQIDRLRMDLCQLLLEEAHVSVVPGSAFGAEGYMRISYATSMANLEKGMDRIERVWRRPGLMAPGTAQGPETITAWKGRERRDGTRRETAHRSVSPGLRAALVLVGGHQDGLLVPAH